MTHDKCAGTELEQAVAELQAAKQNSIVKSAVAQELEKQSEAASEAARAAGAEHRAARVKLLQLCGENVDSSDFRR
ncbi:MAG: hypothetical protein WA777_18525 [Rhodanobacter sp.]